MRVLAVVFVLTLAAPASAHQARTGWVYPFVCCSGQDCRHAEPGEVTAVPGGWRIANTGEVIPQGDARIRPSRDADIHLCQRPDPATGALFTPCLFLPAMF